MNIKRIADLLLAFSLIQAGSSAQSGYTGATEPGVRFPLPQQPKPGTNPPRRLGEGVSNALTVSWDGRLLMYVDSGFAVWGAPPTGALPEGFVFATFNPGAVHLDSQGRPDFTGSIGPVFPRFAAVSDSQPPDSAPQNNYPNFAGAPGAYPFIAGTLGEIGLHGYEVLSNNMYPVPLGELDALHPTAYGHNPYPSDALGAPVLNGSYKTYVTYVTLQDIPKHWDPAQQRWRGLAISSSVPVFHDDSTKYPDGTYPNGEVINSTTIGETIKRNGACKLEITTHPSSHTVVRVSVLEKWKPFQVQGPDEQNPWAQQPSMDPLAGLAVPKSSTMWADNFEPVLTQDGHLMVGKGSPFLCHNIGQTSRVVFYYNQVAFGETGWVGPFELSQLYSKRNIPIGTGEDQRTIAERYPIARHRFKSYDGVELADTDPFEGGYTWLDPDGRFLIYSVYTAGVGSGHTETALAQDGGGISNRGQVSIVGSVTGWQMWRIDHEAVNPSRHLFTGWDQDSRTTFQRTASFGFSPGFWDVLRGTVGLPMRDDGHLKLHLVNSQRLLYYELDLSPYQERDYGLYLPMTEMLYFRPHGLPPTPTVRRDVDTTRTPDLSGHGHYAEVQGGQLPCEYFELPSSINSDYTSSPDEPASLPGFYQAIANVGGYPGGHPSDPTLAGPNWLERDLIQSPLGHHGWWAKLADGKDGKDTTGDGNPDTAPFAGRGNMHDMDSDSCWGRVGEAMFFRDSTKVLVKNDGTPPELNPGTSITGASDQFTASLWLYPMQERSADTPLFVHHFAISLKQSGVVEATIPGATLTSGATTAAVGAWTHVALTWKRTTVTTPSSTMQLFVNGALKATTSLSFDQIPLNGGNLQVGCLATVSTISSKAVLLLDEVALKNSALAGQDIENLALLPIPPKTWDTSSLAALPSEPFPFVNAADARIPVSSPYSAEVAELGADLFRDVQLSGPKDMSCATCHHPDDAFVDGNVAHGLLGRTTPTLYNQRFQVAQFWDARALDLEDQVDDPITSPLEMNNTIQEVLNRLSSDVNYPGRFNSTDFQTPGVSEENLRKALATFQRSMTAADTPADRWATVPLGTDVLRGRGLFFGKARCSGCHSGPDFADGRLWITGISRSDGFDQGAYNSNASPYTAGRARFLGAFKTPTLRELTRTGPYFHDGHALTLNQVVDFYNAGGVRQDAQFPGYALLDPQHDIVAEETNHKLGLTTVERLDLVAYLSALTAGGSSGTGSVHDGPTGLNHAPTVTITRVLITVPPGSTTRVVATILEPLDGGAADLDPTMSWTLEVQLSPGGHLYNWTDASASVISGGYQMTITEPTPSPLAVRVRAADKHGKWSTWATH